jgi:thiamine biosynthesis lipoprotein
VDERRHRVELDDGVLLDFGSSAKAWTCDLIADTIAPLCGVAVEIGGDVAVRGTSPDGGVWAIGLSDSLLVARGPRIGLAHGGVATSSRRIRQWRVNGQRVNHVIDPTTGLPVAGDLETVTVTAATCLEANAFSTAALVWGRRDALSRISQHGWSARAVCEDGSIITAGPWPSEETAA